MSLIDLPTARAHLRLEDDYPDEQVELYLNAAEKTAALFMNRRIYADQAALDAEILTVPAALLAAGTTYTTAIQANLAITDLVARSADDAYALSVYEAAQTTGYQIRAGIVIDDAIRAGILLILGHLFEQRQDTVVGASVATLPMGSRSVLMPYRVAMGI